MTVMYALTVHALRRQLREQRSMTVNQLGIYSGDYRAGLRRLQVPPARAQVWNTTTASQPGSETQVETLFSAVDGPRAARHYDAKPGRFTADGRRAGAPLQGTDRGRRAVRVLGILFAVFVAFYLPFFLAYTVLGTCQSCQPFISPRMITAFEWLQYSGSMVNPIVYHIFNPDFRRAFLKILRCRSSP